MYYNKAKSRSTQIRWRDLTLLQKILDVLQWLIGLTTLSGGALLIYDYGFRLSPAQQDSINNGCLIVGFAFLLEYTLQLFLYKSQNGHAHSRWEFFQQTHHKGKYLLSAVFLFEIIATYLFHVDLQYLEIFQWVHEMTFRDPHILFFQAYIFLNVLRWLAKTTQYLAQYTEFPARFIILSFSSVILLGALLLMLPKSTYHWAHLNFLEALFTSTSAVCVTGLIVVDTATIYTPMGKIIIAGLIQIGGLGIMTITAFFTLLIGQRMSGREQVFLLDMLDASRPAQLEKILRMVVLTAVTIEFFGALSLYFTWQTAFPIRKERLFYAAFHSVSAFCNAGFSTFSDNLMKFGAHPALNVTICGLIILGGLGFTTIHNLRIFLTQRALKKSSGPVTVTLQTKLILLMTAALVVIGTLGFWGLERNNALAHRPLQERVLASFFQSVTFRTAGFNTVDFAKLKQPTLMLGILWMFIGAAPGSTGGGIKVTTFAILLLTMLNFGMGRSRVEIFRRTLPVTVIAQTLVVMTMYLMIAIFITFLLSITEVAQQWSAIDLLFETVSALGTVGLSTGVTPTLTTWGRILIILTMFVGRVGPFTLALAVGQRQRRQEGYRYPEERVQIG